MFQQPCRHFFLACGILLRYRPDSEAGVKLTCTASALDFPSRNMKMSSITLTMATTLKAPQSLRSAAAETPLESSSGTSTRIAFISGPLAPSPTYFAEHYGPRLDTAILQGHAFVVGPSRGVDASRLAYLSQNGVSPGRITVFLSQSERARQREFTARGVKVVIAGRGHTARDAEMTAASDYDILRYQTEAECRALYGSKYRPRVSGTQLNEIRRQEVLAAAQLALESRGDARN
ncbi:hypothetical protein C8F04DRAFT_121896 [Mycena alexandri]|uniref:Uncharacterized protein n=1 Tax=Mycena alexandri TaxID=1745969 RepID=A0AAD6SFK3_9AGAR|nr:hypothetical protein C8F04DRAFT_121896 [Mycena alexandri]